MAINTKDAGKIQGISTNVIRQAVTVCMSTKKKRITKLYYKEWCEELKRNVEEADAEREAMSEAQLEALRERGRTEIDAVCELMKMKRARTLSVNRPVCKMLFDRLSRIALKYAEEDLTDITIETNLRRGVIRMEIGQIILDRQHPRYQRWLWKTLIKHADDIWVVPVERYGESALQYTFFFNFQWDIER